MTKEITDTVRVAGLDQAPGYDAAARIFAERLLVALQLPRRRSSGGSASRSLATWVLMRTRVGNWIFAVGGDAIAARNVGVPVARVKIGLFIATSVAAALVGIMVALRLKSAQAGQGVGLEFNYIIAAVVGGCLLTGGYGSAIGASLGALIIGMAFIGIPFAGWDSDWYYAVPRRDPAAGGARQQRRAPARAGGADDEPSDGGTPLLEVRGTSPSTSATSSPCKDVSAVVNAGQVTCVLGDNGAGKSTLIKILSGVHRPRRRAGTCWTASEVRFASPRDARRPRHRHRLPGPGHGAR